MTFWPQEVPYPVTMQQCNGNAAETSVIRSIPVTDRPDPGSDKDNFQPNLVTLVLN